MYMCGHGMLPTDVRITGSKQCHLNLRYLVESLVARSSKPVGKNAGATGGNTNKG